MSETVECENHALQCMDEALFLSILKTSAIKPRLLRRGGASFFDVSGPGLVDNATGKGYTVVQETERNTVDNLDYQVRTGNLVLEER